MQPGAAILIAKSGISNHAASDIPDHLCFSKFGTFLGVCPQTTDNLRTFGAPVPLRGNMKPCAARYHLLLKTGQMTTQTAASRGYVLLSGANKGHTQKSLNCLRFADTPRGMSKRGKTQNPMLDAARKKYRILFQRIAAPVTFWNFIFSDILIIKRIPFIVFSCGDSQT